MPVTSISGSPSPGNGMWVRIQQQQAQRYADQSEQRARLLQARAQGAQNAADRAQENARSLKVQAGQAEGEANAAKLGLAAQEALGKVQGTLSGLHEQIVAVLSPTQLVQPVGESSAPVLNAQGQQTGTLVNVTA